MSKLWAWFLDNLLVVVLSVLALLAFATMIGAAWDRFPWSDKAQLQRTSTELTQAKDDNLVVSTQADLDRGVSQAASSTERQVIVIQERANAAVRTIEATPPAARDGALVEFLCNGSSLRTADPECDPYRHHP